MDKHRAPNPAALLGLLRAHQAAETEFRAYVMGLLDGLGLPRERFAGIDDAGDLLLAPEPEVGKPEPEVGNG
jgi:hypothetical protein